MIRASAHRWAGIAAAVVGVFAVACGATFEAGAVLPEGGGARLTVLGPAEVTVRNQGTGVLAVRVGWGSAGMTEDEAPAGVARWWTTDGPRWFLVTNHTGRPVAVAFSVKGADASLEQPAR